MISGVWVAPQTTASSTRWSATLLWSLSSGRLRQGYGRLDRLTRIGTAGRRKIRIAFSVNSALDLSTTHSQRLYFFS